MEKKKKKNLKKGDCDVKVRWKKGNILVV